MTLIMPKTCCVCVLLHGDYFLPDKKSWWMTECSDWACTCMRAGKTIAPYHNDRMNQLLHGNNESLLLKKYQDRFIKKPIPAPFGPFTP